MLQEPGLKCFNRLIRALILESSYTVAVVLLEGLPSGVSQRRPFRYYLVIVSMTVVCRMSSLSCVTIQKSNDTEM